MKREKLTNREFDELAKRLFDSAGPEEWEIETIASDPRLFEGVLAKLAAAESESSRPRFAWKPVFAASAAVLLVSVSMLAYFRVGGTTEKAVKIPAVQSGPADHVFTPKRFEPTAPAREHPEPADERPRAEYAAMARQPVESPELRRPRPARVRPMKLPEPEFHPIGPTEKAEDAAIDGRVVRVEMPRAALFALGVNVPLENGMRSVKADLLLGADGSPRAIRLVE